jgi:hypothetical protein
MFSLNVLNNLVLLQVRTSNAKRHREVQLHTAWSCGREGFNPGNARIGARKTGAFAVCLPLAATMSTFGVSQPLHSEFSNGSLLSCHRAAVA